MQGRVRESSFQSLAKVVSKKTLWLAIAISFFISPLALGATMASRKSSLRSTALQNKANAKKKKKKSAQGRRSLSTSSRSIAQLDDQDFAGDLDEELGKEEGGASLPAATEPGPAPESSQASQQPATLGEDVEISDIRYDAKLNGGTVLIATTGAPTYRTREIQSQNQVVVEIANAKLPERLKRPFNTKDFKQAIVSINAYQDQGSNTARIVLQFRQPRSVDVRQNGSSLTVVPLAEGASAVARESTKPSAPITQSDDFGDIEQGGDDEESSADVADDEDSATVSPVVAEPARPSVARASGASSAGKIMPSSSLDDERSGDIRYYGKAISIEVRDTPVRDVIGLISEQSGANIVLADDVTGSITIKLRSIPWDQALAIVMRTRALGYVRQGSVLRIAPIARLQAEAEEARRIIEAQEATLPLKVKVLPVSFANVSTLVTQIRNTLQKAVGSQVVSRGAIEADSRSSSLIVTDTEENIRRIEQLVTALDTPPLQVMIEGKIVEARESNNKELGINWGYSGQDLGFAGGVLSHNAKISPSQVGSATTVNLRLGTLDFLGDLDARLSLLERDSLARVVSSPRIVTMNAQEATIEQALSIAISSTTIVNNLPVTTTTFKEVPTSLKVTPQITPSGDVLMNINFKRQFPADLTGGSANIESREVKTNVMVKNGQTTVIGGVYQADQTEVEEGTPFLKHVPVLGWLFKNQTKQQVRNELLVFLTPRILNADRNLPKRKTL
ncbi:MAG: type IV pilus secretin PilQ [Bdellovibrionales bacterium]|nr:type IV pilus secretin PilQ [Bdellovibrionales bacterium]